MAGSARGNSRRVLPAQVFCSLPCGSSAVIGQVASHRPFGQAGSDMNSRSDERARGDEKPTISKRANDYEKTNRPERPTYQ